MSATKRTGYRVRGKKLRLEQEAAQAAAELKVGPVCPRSGDLTEDNQPLVCTCGVKLQIKNYVVPEHIEPSEPICDCKARACSRLACKGECGCIACQLSYQDYLSADYD